MCAEHSSLALISNSAGQTEWLLASPVVMLVCRTRGRLLNSCCESLIVIRFLRLGPPWAT